MGETVGRFVLGVHRCASRRPTSSLRRSVLLGERRVPNPIQIRLISIFFRLSHTRRHVVAEEIDIPRYKQHPLLRSAGMRSTANNYYERNLNF